MEPLTEGRIQFSLMGNRRIWDLHKTAFLCSRSVPAAQVLKCYDWAIAMREAGTCVMLGAHSQLEKDVLLYLLKGKQPVVVVLARGMKRHHDPVLHDAIALGRLLLVAPFEASVTRVTAKTAGARNRFMLEHAAEVVIGHAASDGTVQHVLAHCRGPVTRL